MHADEIEKVQGDLSVSLTGRLRGIVFSQGLPYLSTGALRPVLMSVYVDGERMVISPNEPIGINILNMNDIETVEVLKSANAAIYGMDGGHGVLVITTKVGGGANPKDIAAVGVLPITPMGFYKAREFYSPKYDNTSRVSNQRDLRSTIYWQPELKTDKNGNASFDYYNADGAGTYKIVIEGIDKDGTIGREVYRYKVQ
ncbi:TonB-dependent receptor plug domain protein [mine drainage metagenome]|uniref:TonB-dependent receptor plug domain protein n=1 Tax=mine drainage metagenome TaxID=410659 RepID=A0A1J5PRU9_9ZZZZ